ncbi:MAG: hypothetical protein ACW99G_06960 [Candidatus Thorarchaeota archaeon]|jgi:hypothetical protein
MKFENWIELKEQMQAAPGGQPAPQQPGTMPGQPQQPVQPGQNNGEDHEVQGLTQAVKMHMGKMIQAMDKQAWNRERRIEFITNLMGEMAGGMGLTLPEVATAAMQYRKAQQ